MGCAVSESMRIALLILSLSNWSEYGTMIALVNSLQKDVTVWNHAFVLFIAESRKLGMKRAMTISRSIAALIHSNDGDRSLNVLKESDSGAVKDGRSDVLNVVKRSK